MTSKATTPKQYLLQLPEDRMEPVARLRKTVLNNLAKGFTEIMPVCYPGVLHPFKISPFNFHVAVKPPAPYES